MRSLGSCKLYQRALGFLVTAIFAFPVTILSLTNYHHSCSVVLRMWANTILLIFGLRTNQTGAYRLTGCNRAFVIANHQSFLDIPVLLTSIPASYNPRFLAKEELFSIPLIGWAMQASGCLPINRKSNRITSEYLAQRLDTNIYSYIVFPEGTRLASGPIESIREGAVGMALKRNVPVIPVCLYYEPSNCRRANLESVHIEVFAAHYPRSKLNSIERRKIVRQLWGAILEHHRAECVTQHGVISKYSTSIL